MFKSLLIAVITISSLCISNVSIAGDALDDYHAQQMIQIERERNELLKEQIEQNRRIERTLKDIEDNQMLFR